MAGFDSFMKVDGVDGEATDDKHKNWIELLGFSHHVDQPTSQTRSSAGGAATGRSVHGDLVITKYLDKATPKLYEALCTGKPFKTIKIEVCRAGGSQLKFYEVNLEEVLISSIHMGSHSAKGASDAADTLPTESVSLNYGKIEWVYTQQKRADGSGGGNVTAKYDLTAGKS